MAKFSQDFITRVFASVQESRKEEERARKVAEKAAQAMKQKVDKRLDEGWSFEDISSDTGADFEYIKSHAESTRPGYGVGKSNLEKAGGIISGVGEALIAGPKRIGEAVGQGFGGQEEQRQLDRSITDSQKAFEGYTRDYREGKIDKKRYEALVQSLGTDKVSDRLEKIEDVTDPTKFVGAAIETGSYLLGGGGIGAAIKGGSKAAIAGAAAATVGAGAAGGAGYGLQQDDASAGDVLKSAAIGGALGLAADVGAAKLGSWLQNRKVLKQFTEAAEANKAFTSQGADEVDSLVRQMDAEDAFIASQGITDTRRMLPDGTDSKAMRVAQIDDELDGLRKGTTDPNVYSSSTDELTALSGEPAGRARINKSGEISKADKTTGVFAETSGKQVADASSTAERARALMRERQQLVAEIDKIKDPQKRLAEGMNLADSDLARARRSGDKTAIQQAEQAVALLDEQADTALNNANLMNPTAPSPPTGKTKVPRAAQRLSDATGVPTDATYNTLPDAVQADAYQSLKNDPQLLEQIVKGEVDGRQYGLTNEYATAQAANEAAKAGDTKAIRDIANGKVLTEASSKGQEISSLRHLDAQSPVRAVKRITEARRAAAKAGKKVAADITDVEVEQILVRSNNKDALYEKYVAELSAGKLSEKTRLEYGKSVVDFSKYVDELMPGKSISDWVKEPGSALMDVAGTTKSLRATGDLSATLRQGLKLLGTGKYKTWAKATASQVRAAVKELGGENAMDWHLADLYSRPNYVNGNYKRFGVAVGDVVEEAFPSKALGKVPVLRRIYNASDSAYTIFNQQARADLADELFDKAVRGGVDLSRDGKQIAAMANALTSRGNIGKLEGSGANLLNNVFFSPRLLKSNIDVLGGHLISGGAGGKFLTEGSSFVRKEAAKNLLKMAVTGFAVYKIAESIRPNSVEWDTRSSNFGKIKVGNTRFDVTGGMGSLITLGGRLHGGSTKSSTTDAVSKLNDKENDYFSRTYADLLSDFASNKLSPAARALTDILQGEDFSGNKPTAGSTVRNLTFPIAVDNFEELRKDKNSAPLLASMILEGLGVSTNTYDSTDDWNVKTTQAQKGFKKAVGDEKFKTANDTYNQRFTDWFREIRYTDQYKKLDDSSRRELVQKAGDKIEKSIMQEYGYRHKTTRKPKNSATDSLIKELGRY